MALFANCVVLCSLLAWQIRAEHTLHPPLAHVHHLIGFEVAGHFEHVAGSACCLNFNIHATGDEACRSKCLEQHTCEAFVFAPDENRCYLLNQKESNFQPAASADVCEHRCADRASCEAFIFSPSTRLCFLVRFLASDARARNSSVIPAKDRIFGLVRERFPEVPQVIRSVSEGSGIYSKLSHVSVVYSDSTLVAVIIFGLSLLGFYRSCVFAWCYTFKGFPKQIFTLVVLHTGILQSSLCGRAYELCRRWQSYARRNLFVLFGRDAIEQSSVFVDGGPDCVPVVAAVSHLKDNDTCGSISGLGQSLCIAPEEDAKDAIMESPIPLYSKRDAAPRSRNEFKMSVTKSYMHRSVDLAGPTNYPVKGAVSPNARGTPLAMLQGEATLMQSHSHEDHPRTCEILGQDVHECNHADSRKVMSRKLIFVIACAALALGAFVSSDTGPLLFTSCCLGICCSILIGFRRHGQQITGAMFLDSLRDLHHMWDRQIKPECSAVFQKAPSDAQLGFLQNDIRVGTGGG